MPRRRHVSAEQEEAIRGMAARGITYREIGETIGISASLVSRIVTPPATREPAFVGAPPAHAAPHSLVAFPAPRPRPPTQPRAAPSAAADHQANEGATHPVEPEPEPEVSDDPRELARQDWLHYERLKLKLRRRADGELAKGNIKGYQLLLRESLAAEKRAMQLRPVPPPDPDTDPTYRAEARKLAQYLEALVVANERSEPEPSRELPPTVPVPEPRA